MAFVLADMVREACNAPGTSDFELLGPPPGVDSLTFASQIGDGNTTIYQAWGAEGWEIGIGEVSTGATNRLLRPGKVRINSSGGTSLIDFQGAVQVACVASPYNLPFMDENGDIPARAGRDLGTQNDRWRNAHLSGVLTVSGNYAVPILLERTDAGFNTHIEYRNTGGSIFAGNVQGNIFAIGDSTDLNSTSNRWFWLDENGVNAKGEILIDGNPVLHQDGNGDVSANGGRDLGTSDDPWRDGHFSRALYAERLTIVRAANTPLMLERTDASFNVLALFRAPAGDVYIGAINGNAFAFGDSNDLNNASNRWAYVDSDGIVARGGTGGALRRVASITTSSDSELVDFPLGHILLVEAAGPHTRNVSVTIRLHESSAYRYSTQGTGAVLTGTWRARGTGPDNYVLFQRVA